MLEIALFVLFAITALTAVILASIALVKVNNHPTILPDVSPVLPEVPEVAKWIDSFRMNDTFRRTSYENVCYCHVRKQVIRLHGENHPSHISSISNDDGLTWSPMPGSEEGPWDTMDLRFVASSPVNGTLIAVGWNIQGAPIRMATHKVGDTTWTVGDAMTVPLPVGNNTSQVVVYGIACNANGVWFLYGTANGTLGMFVVYRSVDDGLSWTLEDVPDSILPNNAWLNYMNGGIDGDIMYLSMSVSHNDGDNERIYRRDSGSAEWSYTNIETRMDQRMFVSVPSLNALVIAGERGSNVTYASMIVTYDKGATWAIIGEGSVVGEHSTGARITNWASIVYKPDTQTIIGIASNNGFNRLLVTKDLHRWNPLSTDLYNIPTETNEEDVDYVIFHEMSGRLMVFTDNNRTLTTSKKVTESDLAYYEIPDELPPARKRA